MKLGAELTSAAETQMASKIKVAGARTENWWWRLCGIVFGSDNWLPHPLAGARSTE